MRFTSFSLFFLTASFVSAKKEDGLQQQQQQQQQQPQQQQKEYNHHELSGGHSDERQEKKKNVRGIMLLNNHHYYNDNVANKDAPIVDVGILSLNSHHNGSNGHHNLDRILQESCNRCYGDQACEPDSGAMIGYCSCNGSGACDQAGNYGDVTIGRNSCNENMACFRLALGISYYVDIGNGSCIGDGSCQEQGYYGNVKIGDGSCIGFSSCFAIVDLEGINLGKSIQIGNNACTCPECCFNISPGSIVGDCQCTSPEDDCARKLVEKPEPRECPSPAPSSMPSHAPSKIPSSAPSSMPSPAPSSMPSTSSMPSPAQSMMPSPAPYSIGSSSKKNAVSSSKKNASRSSKKNASRSSKKNASAEDCDGFVCAFSPKLVEVCIVGTGESEASPQCISKKYAKAALKSNKGNKCGPCDDA